MPSLQKPSKLDRQVRQYARKLARVKAKRVTKRVEWDAEAARRKEAFAREKGKCRAFGTRLRLVSDNPVLVAHLHHIVFRSAGGSDELFNRCILSPKAHEMIHRHELDCEGDGNRTVTFRQRNLETGKILRQWDAPLVEGE